MFSNLALIAFNISCPLSGLSPESLEVHDHFRLADPRFKYKLEKCGPEFKEVQMATLHYLRKGSHVTTSLCAEGILIQFLVRKRSVVSAAAVS